MDAAALSDLTAVRASTVLDIDALKKQLAGRGHHLRSGRCRSERHPARQHGHPSELRRRCPHPGAGRRGPVRDAHDPLPARHQPAGPQAAIPRRDRGRRRHPGHRVVRARPPRSPTPGGSCCGGTPPTAPTRGRCGSSCTVWSRTSGRSGPPARASSSSCSACRGDDAGLAIGPQIASFAASNGIATQLFAAQQHESATPSVGGLLPRVDARGTARGAVGRHRPRLPRPRRPHGAARRAGPRHPRAQRRPRRGWNRSSRRELGLGDPAEPRRRRRRRGPGRTHRRRASSSPTPTPSTAPPGGSRPSRGPDHRHHAPTPITTRSGAVAAPGRAPRPAARAVLRPRGGGQR